MAEMGRRMLRSGTEKSNFAVTCSLLSQYIKEKGSIADLGLGLARCPLENPKGAGEANRTPTTMSLLPGVEVFGSDEGGETKERNGDVSAGNAMELFPQRAGSGLRDDAREEAERGQLTIFYAGKVLVFDNFPAEKAKDLMQLATKGSNNTNTEKFSYAPPSSAAATVDPKNGLSIQTPTVAPSPATSSLATQANNAQKPAQHNLSDLPLVRKASLHRFLEKRKDRLNAKAPYQVIASPLAAAPKKEESESWLGLGPQVPKPSLSLSSEGTQ